MLGDCSPLRRTGNLPHLPPNRLAVGFSEQGKSSLGRPLPLKTASFSWLPGAADQVLWLSPTAVSVCSFPCANLSAGASEAVRRCVMSKRVPVQTLYRRSTSAPTAQSAWPPTAITSSGLRCPAEIPQQGLCRTGGAAVARGESVRVLSCAFCCELGGVCPAASPRGRCQAQARGKLAACLVHPLFPCHRAVDHQCLPAEKNVLCCCC